MKNIILTISIIFNIIILPHIFGIINIRQIFEKDNDEITYFLNRDELFESLQKDSNSIIFLGNSLTQNFELAEFFQDLNIKNRGINGDKIKSVIKRLDNIIECNPKKIFIEIGINDILDGEIKDSVIFNYKKLITILKNKLPGTSIYIQSIFPTDINRINEDIIEINKQLSAYASSQHIVFIDTYSDFSLNHSLNKIYSVDGIHLNGRGYKLWVKILKPYID